MSVAPSSTTLAPSLSVSSSSSSSSSSSVAATAASSSPSPSPSPPSLQDPDSATIILNKSSSSSSSSSGSDSAPIICPGHSRPVPDISFTNDTPDGYFLVSACLDNRAMVRDGVTGDWIGTFLGHKGAVWCVRMNGDASQSVTGSADFTAKLWNACTGDVLHSFDHNHIVKAVSFSCDGTKLFTGGLEKKIRLFDITRPEQTPTVLSAFESAVHFIVPMQHHPSLILAAGPSKGIKIYDIRSGNSEKQLSTSDNVTCVTSSLDNSIISASYGSTCVFYDAKTFEVVAEHALGREIDCIAVSPESNKFVTGSHLELWARMYTLSNGAELSIHKGHHGPVRSLAFSPNSKSFASGSEDGTIRIWQTPKDAK